MRLNDPLITEFVFQGETYGINLAFDVVLDVFEYIRDEEMTMDDRTSLAVSSLIEDVPPEIDKFKIWLFIFSEFLSDGEKEPELDLSGKPVPVKQEEYIDLEQDADFIYSSFLQAYGINLFEQQGKLSWIEFRALLKGLPQNTIMQQIIQIRQWEPYKGVSAEERQRMANLKKQYSLNREEENDG